MPQKEKQTPEKRSVTTADAIRIMAQYGVELSENEAQKLLDFMYFFGKLTVNQYVKDSSKVDRDQPND